MCLANSVFIATFQSYKYKITFFTWCAFKIILKLPNLFYVILKENAASAETTHAKLWICVGC